MRMQVFAANKMREIEDEVKRKGIQKDQIVNIFQSTDGTFVLVYYAE